MIKKNKKLVYDYIKRIKNDDKNNKLKVNFFYKFKINSIKILINFKKIILINLDKYLELNTFFTDDNFLIIPDFFDINIIISFIIKNNTIIIEKYEKPLSMNDFKYISNILHKSTKKTFKNELSVKKMSIKKKIKSKKNKIQKLIENINIKNDKSIKDFHKIKSDNLSTNVLNREHHIEELRKDVFHTNGAVGLFLRTIDKITDNKDYLSNTQIVCEYDKNIVKNYDLKSKFNFLVLFYERLDDSSYLKYVKNKKVTEVVLSFDMLDFFNILKTVNISMKFNKNHIEIIIKTISTLSIENYDEYINRRSIVFDNSYARCWAANHQFGENCKLPGLWGVMRNYCWNHHFICASSLWSNKSFSDPYHDKKSCGPVEIIEKTVNVEKLFNFTKLKEKTFKWEYDLFLLLYDIDPHNKLGLFLNFYEKGIKILYQFIRNFYNQEAYILNLKKLINNFILFYTNIPRIDKWFSENKFNNLVDNKLSQINQSFYSQSIICFETSKRFDNKLVIFKNEFNIGGKLIKVPECISAKEFSKFIKKSNYNKIIKTIDKLLDCASDRTYFNMICYRKPNRYSFKKKKKGIISDFPHLMQIIYLMYCIYILFSLVEDKMQNAKKKIISNRWNAIFNDAIDSYLRVVVGSV